MTEQLPFDSVEAMKVPAEVETFCVACEGSIPSGWSVVVIRRARMVQILDRKGQGYATFTYEAILEGHYKNGYAVPDPG